MQNISLKNVSYNLLNATMRNMNNNIKYEYVTKIVTSHLNNFQIRIKEKYSYI